MDFTEVAVFTYIFLGREKLNVKSKTVVVTVGRGIKFRLIGKYFDTDQMFVEGFKLVS